MKMKNLEFKKIVEEEKKVLREKIQEQMANNLIKEHQERLQTYKKLKFTESELISKKREI